MCGRDGADRLDHRAIAIGQFDMDKARAKIVGALGTLALLMLATSIIFEVLTGHGHVLFDKPASSVASGRMPSADRLGCRVVLIPDSTSGAIPT